MQPEQLGPYRIERPLGRGGMGTVYAAVDTTTQQPAAVKVLAAMLGREEGFRDRFAAEIESLRLLRHPNIVRLLGYGSEGYEPDNELHFYAMELVDGRSLEELLRERRQFEWPEAVDIVQQVCRALKHAHDCGVIHRDIKPANLLLAHDGVLKLSDFGVARLFGNVRLTADGGLLGTAEYMSPEQADGRPATQRSDLYSLGSVLYALLTGRAPFRAKTIPEMLNLQRYADPEPLERLVPHLPRELVAIVAALLEKDPERRVPTALVLQRRLEALQASSARGDDLRVVVPLIAPGTPSQSMPATQENSDASRAVAESPTALVDPPPAERAAPRHASAAVAATSVMPQSLAALPRDVAAVGGGVTGAIEPPRRRFTVVADDDPLVVEPEDHFTWIAPQTWALVIALASIGVVAWWLLQPPSADELYERLNAAAKDDRVERLALYDADIDRFLSIYSHDARSDEVYRWREQVEQYKLERKFLRQVRRGDRPQALSAMERAYFEAMSVREVAPAACRKKLQALIDLYGQPNGDEEVAPLARVCLQMARRQLTALDAQLSQHAALDADVVRERLLQAARQASTDPAAARRIYRATVDLYGDQPWAADLVEQARRELAELP